MTHANFSDLSVKELSFEIKQAKKLLEQKLNTKVNYFAFPKGIYTDESLKIVKKAGFVAAFTVRSGAVKGYSLITPRAIVDKFYSTEEIESLLNPFVIQIKNLMIKFNMWRLVPNL
jgi:peptidoglycan/xylan/chitin deacetylase (PgdA/CDA1 family)